MQYCMVYIAYYTELDLQICNHAQKRHVFRENSKYAPDKNFVAFLTFAENLPIFATLDVIKLSSF